MYTTLEDDPISLCVTAKPPPLFSLSPRRSIPRSHKDRFPIIGVSVRPKKMPLLAAPSQRDLHYTLSCSARELAIEPGPGEKGREVLLQMTQLPMSGAPASLLYPNWFHVPPFFLPEMPLHLLIASVFGCFALVAIVGLLCMVLCKETCTHFFNYGLSPLNE